jgi:hypothetical protein
VYPNHYSYEGCFKRGGVFQGWGTYSTPDGAKFVGTFRAGKANGYGTKYSPSGDILARGIWKNDVLVLIL